MKTFTENRRTGWTGANIPLTETGPLSYFSPMKSPTAHRRLKKGATWLALLVSGFLLCSCAAVADRVEVPKPGPAFCMPAFPDRDGWYGGDGAYSIRLDDERVLWLFGDTFVADREGRPDRVGMPVVLGTTLAVSTCDAEGAFQIRYWLKKKNGRFVSSFGDGEWLWPQDPFLVERTLYVPLVAVTADPQRQGPFPFKIAGHKLARIRDFGGADPNRWAVDYLDLTPDIPKEIKAFATTSVVSGPHVYFFPLYGATRDGAAILGNILARIAVDRLNDPAPAVEYLGRDGQWRNGLDPATVKVVLDAAVSEMSVRYHPEAGKWVAVYLALQNRGDRMLYRTADALEGPWSAPGILLQPIPELVPDSPRYDRNNFCYAGKEHRAFARKQTLVVTYVCNSYEDPEKDDSFIRKNLFLYRPVVSTLELPGVARAPSGHAPMP